MIVSLCPVPKCEGHEPTRSELIEALAAQGWPNYESAARELDNGVEAGPFEWRKKEAKRIVDAAFTGGSDGQA